MDTCWLDFSICYNRSLNNWINFYHYIGSNVSKVKKLFNSLQSNQIQVWAKQNLIFHVNVDVRKSVKIIIKIKIRDYEYPHKFWNRDRQICDGRG